MYYDELSINDANTVANTAFGFMPDVVTAYTLLDDLRDRFFCYADGPKVMGNEAVIDAVLSTALNLLFAALRDYNLLTGDSLGDFSGAIECVVEGGKRAERIIERNRLYNRLLDMRGELTPDEHERLANIRQMTPGDAIPALKELIERREAKDDRT